MITSLPSRRLTALLALALSTFAIVVLLALSAQAKADTHNAACASSVRHGVRACAQSRHASRSHRGKAHAKGKRKGHHGKHVVTPKSAAKKTAGAKGKPKISAATIKTPAICEDGSVPVRESDGFFSCDDESEPGCENGSTPMLSRNGMSLICGPAPKGSPLTEAACEDGSTSNLATDGSFSCDDESEPSCENGSEPVLSSDASHLLCNVSTAEKTSAQ